MHESELLRVSASHVFGEATGYVVECDFYVPLSFSTLPKLELGSYLILGDPLASIFQIRVEPGTQIVREIRAVSLGEAAQWPTVDIEHATSKYATLPVLGTSFPEDTYDVVRVQAEFKASTRPGEVLFFWGKCERCTALRASPASFLIADDLLVGVLISGIDADSMLEFETGWKAALDSRGQVLLL